MSNDLTVRQATAGDVPELLALLRASMQRADDRRFDALYRWKHLDNAFGPSPAWVACDGARIVALRVFMRWELLRAGEVVRAVRAVDTATHPDYQGRGLFTRLTLGALPDLAAEGVEFVFNTPNDQSRPGYLKMGWHDVGRLPTSVRPARPGGALAMARARVPAAHWSEPASFGDPPADVLADTTGIEELLAAVPPSSALRTRLDSAVLRWRYGGDLLQYRAVTGRRGLADGVAFVRVRARGAARELVVAHLVVPGRDRRRTGSLLRAVRRAARGEVDYLLALGRPPGFAPLPGQGPRLTARAVAGDARPPVSVADVALSLGDIELF